MTIIHSSDLGWKAGQDISDEFAALAKTFKPGDTFVFDHMYDISGTDIEIANDVTLKGGTPGAGFNVTDTDTNSQPLISLSDGNSLIDLTVTHSSSTSGRTQKKTFKADADDLTILNSSFSGNAGIFLDVTGDNLLVQDTHFDGGFYQMRWLGETNNAVVDNTLFENSMGDGIKTARGGGEGTQNATIVNSVFLNNNRDGIDTTGGFKNSSVVDSYFVGNGVSGMDIKTPIWEKADLSSDQVARNITVTGSEFINNGNDIVLTTNDRAKLLKDNNVTDWLVQDVFISDTIFENTTSVNHAMVLSKGSKDIYADNVTLLGKIQPYKDLKHKFLDHITVDVNFGLNLSNVATGNPRPGTLDIDYAGMAGPDWSNISYPTDGTPTAIDPVVDPAPISYTPEDEPQQTTDPTPIVEETTAQQAPVAPTPVVPVTSANGLLDVFLAYTDTDETITQFGAISSIDSSLTEGRALTIYATSNGNGPDIGSVRLSVDGVGSRMENVEPYALFGDNGKGDFFGGERLSEGSYTAELVVFSGKNGRGDVLETVAFDFTVDDTGSTASAAPADPIVAGLEDAAPIVETPEEPEPVVEEPVEPAPIPVDVIAAETDLAPDAAFQGSYSKLLDLKIVDTNTDNVLMDLHQGAKLSSNDFSDRKITLSAEAINASAANIGSVRLDLDGQFNKVENVEPYALFGDRNGDFLGGQSLADGTHSATLTAYSGKNGKGEVLEKVTVSFEVGDYDSLLVDGALSTVSSYSESQDTGYAAVSNDQRAIELEGSAWKAVDLFDGITKDTVLKFDFKSDAEGEIQGIGFVNKSGGLETMFFQLDGSQELGIQDFNDAYETGSGFKSYTIPVGEYFTGSVEQLVLVSDDDADLGAMSTFSNIGLIEGIA